MEERPITVRDPARPARAADLLVSGQQEPRPSPFTPRRLKALTGVGLVLAAGLGVVEVRERRAVAAQERRLDRVLELVVESSGGSSSYDPRRGAAELTLHVDVRNDGPRAVLVEQGTAGEYVLARTLVEVAAGGQVPLVLRQEVACSASTRPPSMPLDGLRLELRTAAGPRSVRLPFDPEPVRDHAARACGFVPLEEAVDIQVLGASRPAGALELALDLSSRSIEPVSVAVIAVPPGLRVEVRSTDRGPVELPLALPPNRRDAIRRGTYVELRVTVVDCAAARSTAPQLELQVTDQVGRRAATVIDYDPAFLGSLLSTACPT